MLRVLFLLLILGVMGAAGIFLYGAAQYRAQGPLTEDAVVMVPRGAGVQEISRTLAEHRAIDNMPLFQVAAHLTREEGGLRAGEYRIPAGSSPAEILRILRRGQTILHQFTLPEGLTTMEVLTLVNADPVLAGPPLRPEDIDFAEGIVLPETYSFPRGYERRQLFDRMRQAMRQKLDQLWKNRAPDLPVKTPEEAVVLASIVEKETGLPAERPHIAGVFVNRLRKGMKLQTDPTVIFALTQGKAPLGRALTTKDLQFPSPYNTYVIEGLPPGPIANPGAASLQATLNPMQTRDLFFVADGSGGHAFSETYAEHLKKVRQWRQIKKQRQDGK